MSNPVKNAAAIAALGLVVFAHDPATLPSQDTDTSHVVTAPVSLLTGDCGEFLARLHETGEDWVELKREQIEDADFNEHAPELAHKGATEMLDKWNQRQYPA